MRLTLIVCGTICTALGVIGIFVPLLPTTPFLLLAAACYARSSERFYNWLMNNRIFGRYVRDYLEKRGISLKVKIVTLVLLWATIILSAIFATDALWLRILLVSIAVGVTIHILWIRTLKDQPPINAD
jgi:uncharacterized membrane protein YbaN (DUF454 family)